LTHLTCSAVSGELGFRFDFALERHSSASSVNASSGVCPCSCSQQSHG
jgi:hypothetical protein